MKNKTAFAAALLLFVFIFSCCSAESDQDAAASPTLSPETWVAAYIAAETAFMRAEPSEEADIVISFACGIEVERLNDEDGWSKVRYGSYTGYICSDMLSDTQPALSEMPDLLDSPGIVVKKGERILELWDGDTLFGSYPAALGWEPEGHKQAEGDGRTPEGAYYVCVRNGNSNFYLSLGVSYPNKDDAQAALDAGIISQSVYDRIAGAIDDKAQPPWNTVLGGEIMIHGGGTASDWTAGCIAVSNDIMDILWKYCPLGTPIIIEP